MTRHREEWCLHAYRYFARRLPPEEVPQTAEDLAVVVVEQLLSEGYCARDPGDFSGVYARARTVLQAHQGQASVGAHLRSSDGSLVLAWKMLEEAERELLMLSQWERLGAPAIALVLGVGEQELRLQLSSAEEKLNKLYVSLQEVHES